jgi:preprotein translocase subunit SecE
VNRETKRRMAKAGMDPETGGRAADRRGAPAPPVEKRERTSPKQYVSEVRGEMKKVVWPTRSEVINSSTIVLIAVVFMTGLIFLFDWMSNSGVRFLFD